MARVCLLFSGLGCAVRLAAWKQAGPSYLLPISRGRVGLQHLLRPCSFCMAWWPRWLRAHVEFCGVLISFSICEFSISLVCSPKYMNNISILIVLTSSSQWSTSYIYLIRLCNSKNSNFFSCQFSRSCICTIYYLLTRILSISCKTTPRTITHGTC